MNVTTMEPTVTVLMAVRNGFPYLSDSIDSILSQDFADFEFIIVDDGSTDSTPAILTDKAAADPRVRVRRNDVNLGLPASLNVGLRYARGKYVARMDSDDIALPFRLSRQIEYLEMHPKVFLVGSQTENIDEAGARICINRCPSDPDMVCRQLSEGNCIPHPTIVFRREEGVAYREKFLYAQDYDFYLRLLAAGRRMANHPEVLLKYRVNAGSISESKRMAQLYYERMAREFYRQRLATGEDDYASLPESAIGDDAFREMFPREALEAEIHDAMSTGRFAEARKAIREYGSRYGVSMRFVRWFMASFLGRRGYDVQMRVLAAIRRTLR